MKELVLWRKSAERDVLRIASNYVAVGGAELGLRFLRATDETLALLATMPEMGSPRQLKHGRIRAVRAWRVPGFDDFNIYYEPLPDGIRVIRVIHAKMDARGFLS